MKIYHYDRNTREFMGEAEARLDPRTPGRFLIPKNSTTKQPPSDAPNKIAQFDPVASQWALVADFRDQAYYETDGTKHELPIGDKPDRAWTTVPPVKPPVVEDQGEKRIRFYSERGATPAQMIEAIWQSMFEGDDTEKDRIQAIRTKIQQEIPLNEEANRNTGNGPDNRPPNRPV